MDYSSNIVYGSDDNIIALIGNYVRHHRLDQNITQQELAYKAGINRTTLADLESGKRCQLLTLIQVLRILQKLEVLEVFKVRQPISPMLLAAEEMKKYRRARSRKNTPPPKTSDW